MLHTPVNALIARVPHVYYSLNDDVVSRQRTTSFLRLIQADIIMTTIIIILLKFNHHATVMTTNIKLSPHFAVLSTCPPTIVCWMLHSTGHLISPRPTSPHIHIIISHPINGNPRIPFTIRKTPHQSRCRCCYRCRSPLPRTLIHTPSFNLMMRCCKFMGLHRLHNTTLSGVLRDSIADNKTAHATKNPEKNFLFRTRHKS